MNEQCRDEIYMNARRILEMVGTKQHLSQSSSKNVDQAGGRLKRRKIDLINENSVMQEYAEEAEEDDLYLDEVDRYKHMKLPLSNNEIIITVVD